ncbi:Hypothetical predicted protein [Lecanosticta acicola]|uniref:Uncharacterized protein n=1 Tax=Lecanosticta acicola TaxID=111012 RepID=A0AAI8Z5G6_9PEZI|nr:Hypothetical predicted protein [Lecanosticta acicola]
MLPTRTRKTNTKIKIGGSKRKKKTDDGMSESEQDDGTGHDLANADTNANTTEAAGSSAAEKSLEGTIEKIRDGGSSGLHASSPTPSTSGGHVGHLDRHSRDGADTSLLPDHNANSGSSSSGHPVPTPPHHVHIPPPTTGNTSATDHRKDTFLAFVILLLIVALAYSLSSPSATTTTGTQADASHKSEPLIEGGSMLKRGRDSIEFVPFRERDPWFQGGDLHDERG